MSTFKGLLGMQIFTVAHLGRGSQVYTVHANRKGSGFMAELNPWP